MTAPPARRCRGRRQGVCPLPPFAAARCSRPSRPPPRAFGINARLSRTGAVPPLRPLDDRGGNLPPSPDRPPLSRRPPTTTAAPPAGVPAAPPPPPPEPPSPPAPRLAAAAPSGRRRRAPPAGAASGCSTRPSAGGVGGPHAAGGRGRSGGTERRNAHVGGNMRMPLTPLNVRRQNIWTLHHSKNLVQNGDRPRASYETAVSGTGREIALEGRVTIQCDTTTGWMRTTRKIDVSVHQIRVGLAEWRFGLSSVWRIRRICQNSGSVRQNDTCSVETWPKVDHVYVLLTTQEQGHSRGGTSASPPSDSTTAGKPLPSTTTGKRRRQSVLVEGQDAAEDGAAVERACRRRSVICLALQGLSRACRSNARGIRCWSQHALDPGEIFVGSAAPWLHSLRAVLREY